MELNEQDILRYDRQLPLIGVNGQKKLKSTAVLCVGAGGLGAPVLQYLCAAGIGTLGIVDGDQVELSNLPRQVLFKTSDLGQSKVIAAKNTLKSQNPDTHLILFNEFLSAHNAQSMIEPFDIIVDCTDNYKARYVINDACIALKKPLVSASIHQFQGQCSVFNAHDGPCYRCLYKIPPPPELTPNCAQAGVLGVLPSMLGSIQACETIKLALSMGDTLSSRLLCVDLLTVKITEYTVQKNPHCPACHDHQSSTHLFSEAAPFDPITEITPQELSRWLSNPQENLLLLDVRDPGEYDIRPIDGSQLIPLEQLTEKGKTLLHASRIVVYCQRGTRSKQAASLLLQQGCTAVYSLKGGIINWIEQRQT